MTKRELYGWSKHQDTVTLIDILTKDKYKKMTVDELDYVINMRCTYPCYQNLEGNGSLEKAQNLFKKFNP